MGRRAKARIEFDVELDDLPQQARWREWMGRVEAVIFASPKPVPRETLARVVGRSCNLDLLIADIRDELRGRPYELASVAGGFQHRTRRAFADAIRATGLVGTPQTLSQHELMVLTVVGYFQLVTRGELGEFFGREISRDTIASLRQRDLIASGPRSPQPGAPYTYVTTPASLSEFGFQSLRDLPDMEKLEVAGLLSRSALLNAPLTILSGIADDPGEETFLEEDEPADSLEDLLAEMRAHSGVET
ncbi:Chromosome segregation and condensation protein ScpB [Rhizobiales bacterium GAS191]|nr:Chromosome segregation and condensation protein ScpB [Rhizobiales bacterium GAS191]